jgi:hypothetical protein
MALGWCPACDKLVAIRPGPQKWGSREREWHTVDHDTPEGKRCQNKKAL